MIRTIPGVEKIMEDIGRTEKSTTGTIAEKRRGTTGTGGGKMIGMTGTREAEKMIETTDTGAKTGTETGTKDPRGAEKMRKISRQVGSLVLLKTMCSSSLLNPPIDLP